MKPFREIYYKDCYYNALFPVLTYFNRPLTPFLLNDIFIYRYTPSSCVIKHDIVPIQGEKRILDRLGLWKKERRYSNDMLQLAMAALRLNRPVIVFVDCYYLPLRLDAYRKLHFPHFLLLFGCSSRNRTFRAMEHKYRDSFDYAEEDISIEDLHAAYSGAFREFQPPPELSTYSEYGILNESSGAQGSEQEYLWTYRQAMLEREEEIRAGLSQLRQFQCDMSAVMSDQEAIYREAGRLLDVSAVIFNNLRLEQYRLTRVFGPNPEWEQLGGVLDNWNFIRGILKKFMLTNVYQEKSFARAQERLEQIVTSEERMYEGLFALLHAMVRP
ncbi:hypothetical protein DNH61_06310 [Paenibacillus sambharensis]|uniref:Butirosin biosynthesis protein H N-terminal domain-containing protein n=2 Tax=Paenibacillus sambharensis TaxID=1803190 RepID=A0A2W1LZ70_9BACL|nr:hypothetical protein DNH61_06310 [Paenibacillus sambharensis]